MSRSSSLKYYCIDEELDPRLKFNSLMSVTVSTLMCLASKSPLPRPNVETTKLFLRTITDDKGKAPKNVRDFLTYLNNYSGPYDSDSTKEKYVKESYEEKLLDDEAKSSGDPAVLDKTSGIIDIVKEMSPNLEGQIFSKQSSKINIKKGDKESVKKIIKNSGIKLSSWKSTISNKT